MIVEETYNFPRRRISARRNFPQGCGKNVTSHENGNLLVSPDSMQEGIPRQRLIVKLKVNSPSNSSNSAPENNRSEHVDINGGKRIKTEEERNIHSAVASEEKVHPEVRSEGEVPAVVKNEEEIHAARDSVPLTIRGKVRQILRLFQAHCRKLSRDDEGKTKVKDNKRGPKQRVDLATAGMLKQRNLWVNTGMKFLGNVPRVEVGDEFHYRVELSIVGLHGPFMAGIDYVNSRGKIVATSIVSSGCYTDYMDSWDILVYSGQGGTPIPGYKITQASDQKLVRGNLALKNSMDEQTPVRVIRGFKDTSAEAKMNMTATLTYDGLYIVEKYWKEKEKGEYGTYVYMFQLKRIPGQPQLAIKEVKKSKKARVREGLCVIDISQGKERMPDELEITYFYILSMPIAAVNTINDEKTPPFVYLSKMVHPQRFNPSPSRGCGCIGRCSSSTCLCAHKNGGQIPFNYNGAIVEAKPLVYECGLACKCSKSCYNRVSQHGIKFQLEVFKTDSRGWGVRSLDSISSGSFVCEYTGEFLLDEEAEQRMGNDEYLFDIGKNYNHDALWGGLSELMSSELESGSPSEVEEDTSFTIDAAKYGSVGRFINHSCSPNLYAQNVLYDHDDRRMPHIMLFAAENIPPLTELTYHYNYQLDQVFDAHGNIKRKNCYCGSDECTSRMYLLGKLVRPRE
ncbi:[histone H3]-lysine(4) N-trimethyltransferase [Ranunculus cassubicifolius]